MSKRTSEHRKAKHRRIESWSGFKHPELAAFGIAAQDVIDLEHAVYGQTVLPEDVDYDLARQVHEPAFQNFPLLIAYCETPGDVRHCLAFARRHELRVTCRSGGHNTAGYSVGNDAMVIDTSRMQYVHLSHDDGGDGLPIAHVGAGSQWGYVAAVLDSHGFHVPGGACESVCVAGYMQGGGYCFTSRMYGMNCDNVVAVKVMLADGRIVIANEQQNAPLFWAIRGGTGNNFGVLLEISYQVQRPDPLWGFSIRWEIDDAPQAIVAMQDGFMKTNPSRRIGYETQGITIDGRQILQMRGMIRGSETEALADLRPMLATPGAQLEYGFPSSYYELNRRHDIGFPGPMPTGIKEDKQSGYLRAPLTFAEWEQVIDMFKRSPNPYSIFNIEAYGAAINDVALGTNAFMHRDAYCDFYLDVFWVEESERQTSVQYLDDFMAMMQPFFERPDGRAQSNQNYPRATLTNYMELYFDGFVRDLVTAKRLYDPENRFGFEQGIPLEVPADARVDPASPGFTGNEIIIAEDI
ncbi:MAG: FAD-binding oxidoreductase [Pseudomonadota bacterium]